MRMTRLFAAALALAALCGAGFAQNAPPPAPPAAAASAAEPVPYKLTMGDMMNTLVQPRHAKLGLAGQQENWPLAGYALAEIHQAFTGIGKALPKFRGMPVPDLIEAAMTAPMTALDAAIKQQDKQKFDSAYEQLGAGCNACHTTLDHAYVVIKTPDVTAFPDQDFAVRRK
jgi:hypothetical protein